MRVIAICGPKRSGKDTIAKHITEKYGYKHFKIAENLKSVCGLLFGFSHEQMEDDSKDKVDPKYNISPRQAMQFVGTEMMQYKIQELLPNVGRNFWINLLLQNTKNESHIVISDMRFLHEYEALRRYDLFVIQVFKDLHIQTLDNHSSEIEWSKIPANIKIHNNSSIENMYKCIDDALVKINNS